MEPVLSIYVDEMGVYFWEGQIVDCDRARFNIEEDFGISHNRSMDIEAFQDIMFAYGHHGVFEQYLVTHDEKFIAELVAEFK